MAYAADLCGSKLKAKLASTLNEASAAPISSTSFAAKQMAKMGWKEGTGLGKNRNGIVSHIKVKKREENMGLGVEKERTRKLGVEGMWWSSNVSDTLMRLQNQKKSEKKDKKSKDKKSKKSKKDKDKKVKKKKKVVKPKIYTDEELFQATGGARFGMRAQRRAEGKWKRTEDSQSLKEWEKEVSSKIEWNGLGKAEVLLTGKENSNSKSTSSSKKRSRQDDDCFEEEKKEDDNIPSIATGTATATITKESDVSDVGIEGGKDEKKKRKKKKSEKKASSKKAKKSKEIPIE